ncbi:GPP34 family phosphoprotein [Thermoflavimicrobium daqui]|nr:GPP34 family phosphoprotein [Thermoflavimicrobium daqui]
MRDSLTLTEKFALLYMNGLNHDEDVFAEEYKEEKNMYAILIELLMEKCIQINDRRVVEFVQPPLDQPKYMNLVIKALSDPNPLLARKLKSWVDFFKAREELLHKIHSDILDRLKNKDLLFDIEEKQVYLVMTKTIYHLETDTTESMIKQMKKELMGDEPLTKQTFALYLLLKITKVVDYYFSKDIQRKINQILDLYLTENQEIKGWIRQLLSTGTKAPKKKNKVKRKTDEEDDEAIYENDREEDNDNQEGDDDEDEEGFIEAVGEFLSEIFD